jgi:hypothetical protein
MKDNTQENFEKAKAEYAGRCSICGHGGHQSQPYYYSQTDNGLPTSGNICQTTGKEQTTYTGF